MELDHIFYIHTGKFISNSNTNHLSDFESHKKIIMKESTCNKLHTERFYIVS